MPRAVKDILADCLSIQPGFFENYNLALNHFDSKLIVIKSFLSLILSEKIQHWLRRVETLQGSTRIYTWGLVHKIEFIVSSGFSQNGSVVFLETVALGTKSGS